MVDYWFVSWFGRIWLAARRRAGLREINAGSPELCARVARGDSLPAGKLLMAEDFAAAMWSRWAMVAGVGFVVIAIAAKGWLHGTVLDVAADLLLAVVFCAAMAGLQVAMALVRAGYIRSYLRRAEAEARSEPLPTLSLGVPRRRDFWVALAVGAVMCGVLGYAGLNARPH